MHTSYCFVFALTLFVDGSVLIHTYHKRVLICKPHHLFFIVMEFGLALFVLTTVLISYAPIVWIQHKWDNYTGMWDQVKQINWPEEFTLPTLLLSISHMGNI